LSIFISSVYTVKIVYESENNFLELGRYESSDKKGFVAENEKN